MLNINDLLTFLLFSFVLTYWWKTSLISFSILNLVLFNSMNYWSSLQIYIHIYLFSLFYSTFQQQFVRNIFHELVLIQIFDSFNIIYSTLVPGLPTNNDCKCEGRDSKVFVDISLSPRWPASCGRSLYSKMAAAHDIHVINIICSAARWFLSM